jgi:hypothetical protein
VSADHASGTVLIQENTLLPAGLSIESEAFLPGWKAVGNLDAYELGRKIAEVNWNFFYLAGEVSATVLGRYGPETLRKAVKRVLLKREEKRFNSFEITKVVSKRFLGIPFVKVTAHSRHIQESVSLLPAKDVVLVTRPLAAPEIAIATSTDDGQTGTRQHTALISSS